MKDGKCINVIVRMALISVMCDIPASCGFSSFNALHGCNKCMKQFRRDAFGESPDYSGYDKTE